MLTIHDFLNKYKLTNFDEKLILKIKNLTIVDQNIWFISDYRFNDNQKKIDGLFWVNCSAIDLYLASYYFFLRIYFDGHLKWYIYDIDGFHSPVTFDRVIEDLSNSNNPITQNIIENLIFNLDFIK